MFQRILAWIREVWSKMIGVSNIKTALAVDVAITPRMAEALQLWSLMYNNFSPWLGRDVHSLNLAAAISAEIARTATIEMKIAITGSARAVWLQEQIDRLALKLRHYTEYGCAKGGLMLKPYIDASGQIAVDVIQADMFYPVAFDASGNITSCIFADQRTVGREYYTRLEYHSMTAEGCVIRNLAYRSLSRDTLGNQVPLSAVGDWAALLPEATITSVKKLLVGYFRYPTANNIDVTSPLGVSCFARAVNLIEQADRQWSNLLWEFESGQRALYTDAAAFKQDPVTGLPILPNRRLYRTLEESGEVGKGGLFEDWSPSLREENILRGLDAILREIEFVSGLAYGTLSNPQTVDKTATEIKISRQRSYATVTDTQKALKTALDDLLYAMDVWATLGNLAPRGSWAANYDFDDSVITDKDVQMTQDRQTVSGGMMPKYVFLMRNYGMDEASARAWIADVTAEQPADLFPGIPK
jgi:A118 family predicted phage portal protein